MTDQVIIDKVFLRLSAGLPLKSGLFYFHRVLVRYARWIERVKYQKAIDFDRLMHSPGHDWAYEYYKE